MTHTVLELVDAIRWVGLGLLVVTPLAMTWLGRRRAEPRRIAEYYVEPDAGDELRFVARDERIACDDREVA